MHTGLVPRLPTAVLATGLMVIAFLSLTCGLILDTVTRGRWEAKRMAYLAIPGPARTQVKRLSRNEARYLLRHPLSASPSIGRAGLCGRRRGSGLYHRHR